jgi:DNA-binding response OmpR family regulator
MKLVLFQKSAADRRLLARIARAAGHEVIIVPDGEAEWQAAERDAPDLIVRDWDLSFQDGSSFVRRLRGRGPSAGHARPYILMLADADGPDDLDLAIDLGVDDYLIRPITESKFRTRLRIAERRIAEHRQREQAIVAKGQWLAGIGETRLTLQHEINNPLVALLLAAQLLERASELSDEQRENTAIVIREARRIASVVKRLTTIKNPETVTNLDGSKMIAMPPESG